MHLELRKTFADLDSRFKEQKAILRITLKAIILFPRSTPSGFVSSRGTVKMLLWKFAPEIVVTLSSEWQML